MTAQEKRTKSGEIVLNLIQGKTTATVAEVERKTKLPHEEIIATLKDLESRGKGRFIVGRRGAPSRFVRFSQPANPAQPLPDPIDVRVAELHGDGRTELRFSTDPGHLGSLVARLKNSGILAFAVDNSNDKTEVVVMVDAGNLETVLRGLKGGVTN